MDNCGGQNKNGTVLKMGAYFVEQGWFKKVNYIFLIKGHTKNACDRMFNMLKIKWHKSNVYSMEQAIEVLNAAENVTAIEAGHIHVDYASLFDRWYKQPASGSIQKNHIFSFCSDTIKNVILTSKSSHIAAVTSTQSIKKIDKNVPDHVRKMDLLWAKVTFLPKPGLKPIKQVHLYTKWRSVVPHPFKDDLCPLPPNDIIRQVIKKRKPKKKNDTTNNMTATQTNNTSTTAKRSKPKEHETRTVVVEGVAVDADPLLIASDDEDSNYVDPNYNDDTTTIESEEEEVTRPRGKTILPPKPKAATTKTQKIEKHKSSSETKEKAKEKKRKINENRIMTRNKKRIEREKRTRVSKRVRRNTDFYSVKKF